MRALLIILALSISSTAMARPNFGPTCASGGCHSTGNPTGGSISTLVAELEILLGESGSITFNLADAPDTGAIGVYGLDAAGLTATDIGSGWTDGPGDYFYSDIFANTTTGYDLSLAIPSDATLGTYTIDFIFAGPGGTPGTGNGGRWATDIESTTVAHSFDLVVSQIPVPAAVWLFGSGLLGLVGVARRRRRNA